MSKTEIGEFGQPHDVRHGDVSYWRAAEVEEREIVQRLQRGQFGIANCSYGDRQSLELCETPHVFEHSVGFKAGKPDGRDVTEEVDTYQIHEPPRRPRFSPQDLLPVGRIPVIRDLASGVLNLRHRVALDLRVANKPCQPHADNEHKDDQPADAKSQVSSPGTRY